MWKRIKPYAVSVITALAVGGISAIITRDNMMLYGDIVKPPLAPPAVLFPIVWTILYILMGIGSAVIYGERGTAPEAVSSALRIYGAQLVINFLWSIIFFNMREFLFAFIWLVLLLVLIVLMIAKFKTVNKTAAYLQIPYLLWVIFAGYLNLMIYLLNG